jgi:hypothetical protein
MSWSLLIDAVRPHVVKISTPDGFGTGFLQFYTYDKKWCGIATAAHVVNHADHWQQPIRVYDPASGAPVLLSHVQRVIFIDRRTDSAVLLFLNGDLQLPEIPVTLFPMSKPHGLGVDVGWLGFPTVEPDTLCFFSGAIRARLENHSAYLIDGVAINGVSGGPVFHTSLSGAPQIIGCVSAYHPNSATGEALPGLLLAQDVSHFHGVADHVRSIDEANWKKAEFEAAQKARPQSQPTSSDAPPHHIDTSSRQNLDIT